MTIPKSINALKTTYIQSTRLSDLEKLVNAKLDYGWILVGPTLLQKQETSSGKKVTIFIQQLALPKQS